MAVRAKDSDADRAYEALLAEFDELIELDILDAPNLAQSALNDRQLLLRLQNTLEQQETEAEKARQRLLTRRSARISRAEDRADAAMRKAQAEADQLWQQYERRWKTVEKAVSDQGGFFRGRIRLVEDDDLPGGWAVLSDPRWVNDDDYSPLHNSRDIHHDIMEMFRDDVEAALSIRADYRRMSDRATEARGNKENAAQRAESSKTAQAEAAQVVNLEQRIGDLNTQIKIVLDARRIATKRSLGSGVGSARDGMGPDSQGGAH